MPTGEGDDMRRREFLAAGVGGGLAHAALASAPAGSAPPEAQPFQSATPEARRRRRFPDLHLTTHEGTSVRLYEDLLEGKTVLVHFMYTTCTDSCPLTTANLARVRDLLGPRVGREVFLYSVTVDPSHDTPARLREYAGRFDVTPGWLFLTGQRQDIRTLRACFGDDPRRATGQSDHLNLLTYGVEPLERWGACPAMADPQWIARYLSWLDPNGERPTGWWPPGRGASGEKAVRSSRT
jgi:protein SCO1/2